MATTISANVYNQIQTKISRVLGFGDGNYGYGQLVTSGQVTSATVMSSGVWTNLKNDMIRARSYQTGSEISLPNTSSNTPITQLDIDTFNSVATAIDTNKFVLPLSQATRTIMADGQVTSAWNGTLTQEVTIQFDSYDYARAFFNTASVLEITATRSGGATNTKNGSWTSILDSSGIVKFGYTTTTSTGSGGTPSNIGFEDLALTDKEIFSISPTGEFAVNKYSISARKDNSGAQIILTIKFDDIYTTSPDVDVSGTLVSRVSAYRADTDFVRVPLPASYGSFSGTYTAPIPAPITTYVITYNSVVNPATVALNEGGSEIEVEVIASNAVPNTTITYSIVAAMNQATGLLYAIDIKDFDKPSKLVGNEILLEPTATPGVSSQKFYLKASADASTEQLEKFDLVFKDANSVILATKTISINDLSTTPSVTKPTYKPSQTITVNETTNNTATLVVEVENTSKSLLPYTITGTRINSDDYTATPATAITLLPVAAGSNKKTGTLTIVTKADSSINEGNETMQVLFSPEAEEAASFYMDVVIQDTSQKGDYVVAVTRNSLSVSSMNETGSSNAVTVTISAPNVAATTPASTASYIINAAADTYIVTQSDMTTSGATTDHLKGTVTLNTNPAGGVIGSFTITAANDHVTEGDEQIKVSITMPDTSVQTLTLTIADTSITPVYTVSSSLGSLIPGGAASTIKLRVVNLPQNSTVDYVLSGTNISKEDFGRSSLTGSVTLATSETIGGVVGYYGTFDLAAISDGDPAEKVFIEFTKVDGTKTTPFELPISGTAVTGTYEIQSAPATLDEGNSTTVTILATNVAANDVIYKFSGAGIDANDFDPAGVGGTLPLVPVTGQPTKKSATLTIIPRADHISESTGSPGYEDLVLTVLDASGNEADVATIQIMDKSKTPEYTIAVTTLAGAAVTDVNEGTTYKITLNTKYLPATSQIAYSISNCQRNDFSNPTSGTTSDAQGSLLSDTMTGVLTLGSVVDNAASGYITLAIAADAFSDADTFTITFTKLYSQGEISKNIKINDTSKTVIFDVLSNSTNNTFNESGTSTNVLISFQAINLTADTYIPYKIVSKASGSDVVNSSDFSPTSTPLNGQLTLVVSDPAYPTIRSAILSLTIRADSFTEGEEKFTVLFTKPDGGTKPIDITINDTSLSPAAVGYTLQQTVTTISETTGVTYTINTPSTVTTLYYVISGSSAGDVLEVADFLTIPGTGSPASLSGQISVVNGVGTLTLNANPDYKTEGLEQFTVYFRETPTGTNLTTTPASRTVSINDTTRKSTYASSIVGMVDGQESQYAIAELAVVAMQYTNKFRVKLNTTALENTDVYMTFDGTATYGTDYVYVPGGTGSVTLTPITSGSVLTGYQFKVQGTSMYWDFTVADDHISENGNETVTVNFRTGSVTGTIEGTAQATIIGNSGTPGYTLTLTPFSDTTQRSAATLLDETTSYFDDSGTNYTNRFTLTLDVANGYNQTLYLRHTGTATMNSSGVSNPDFNMMSTSSVIPSLSGEFTLTSNQVIWAFEIQRDSRTDPAETIQFKLYKDAAYTNELYSTGTLTIADTSLTPPSGSVVAYKTGTTALPWPTVATITVTEGTNTGTVADKLTLLIRANADANKVSTIPNGKTYYIRGVLTPSNNLLDFSFNGDLDLASDQFVSGDGAFITNMINKGTSAAPDFQQELILPIRKDYYTDGEDRIVFNIYALHPDELVKTYENIEQPVGVLPSPICVSNAVVIQDTSTTPTGAITFKSDSTSSSTDPSASNTAIFSLTGTTMKVGSSMVGKTMRFSIYGGKGGNNGGGYSAQGNGRPGDAIRFEYKAVKDDVITISAGPAGTNGYHQSGWSWGLSTPGAGGAATVVSINNQIVAIAAGGGGGGTGWSNDGAHKNKNPDGLAYTTSAGVDGVATPSAGAGYGSQGRFGFGGGGGGLTRGITPVWSGWADSNDNRHGAGWGQDGQSWYTTSFTEKLSSFIVSSRSSSSGNGYVVVTY